jgi:hypothetical protein
MDIKTNLMKYDTTYFENMIEMYAGTGRKVNEIRWDFLKDLNPRVVLDYGCGCNMFDLYRPEEVLVDSYDIGTIGVSAYPQTGIRHDWYDVICFWDVLEHVDWDNTPDEDILKWMQRADFVAISMPILPSCFENIDEWKHHKPGEHLTYFTVDSLTAFMEEQGFELYIHNMPECPPREDIHSFIFRNLK